MRKTTLGVVAMVWAVFVQAAPRPLTVSTDRPIGLEKCGTYAVTGTIRCNDKRCILIQNQNALSEVTYKLTQPYFQFNLFNHQLVTVKLKQEQRSGTRLSYIPDSISIAQENAPSSPKLLQAGTCQP